MVLVPFSLLPIPCASQPSSLANERVHDSLCFALLMRCRYSIEAPVMGSMIALANCWVGTCIAPLSSCCLLLVEYRCVGYWCGGCVSVVPTLGDGAGRLKLTLGDGVALVLPTLGDGAWGIALGVVVVLLLRC